MNPTLFFAILASALISSRLILWLFGWLFGMSLDGKPRVLFAALPTLTLALATGIQVAGVWIGVTSSLLAVGAWTYVDLAKLKRADGSVPGA